MIVHRITVVTTAALLVVAVVQVVGGLTAQKEIEDRFRSATLSTKAIKTPIATILPRSWKGGASEKFMLRKPIAVVTLVRKTGCKLMRMLSTIAAVRVPPFCIVNR